MGSKRKPRSGRTTLANGRSEQSKKYVKLNHWMMESEAWKSLDPFEARLLVELYSLYSGFNNGYLFLSVREAGKRCNMSKDKASASFHVLQDRGFVRRRADEPENYSLREANHWILNEFPFGNREGSKAFMKWRAEIQDDRATSGTACPTSGTISLPNNQDRTELSGKSDDIIPFPAPHVPKAGHS